MKKVLAYVLILTMAFSFSVSVTASTETNTEILFNTDFEDSSAEGYTPGLFQLSGVSYTNLNDGVHNKVLLFENEKSWHSPMWDLNSKLKTFAQKHSGENLEIIVSVDILSHGKDGNAGLLFRGSPYYQVLKQTTNIGLDRWATFNGSLKISAEETLSLADKGELLLMFENLTENNTYYLDNLSVTVKVLPEIKGAEISLGGLPFAIVGTEENSPFAKLDFGDESIKTLTFTVYNTSSTDIETVYAVCGWNTYFTESGTKIDGTMSSKKIPSGTKATVSIKVPKKATVNYDNVEKTYAQMALRFDFADSTVSGESITVSCTDKKVNSGTAESKPFSGVLNIKGVTELPILDDVDSINYDFTTGVKQADGSIVYSNGYVPVTDENLLFSGRWTEKDGKMTLGFEGYAEISFTGTSLKALNIKSWNVYASVDGGEPKKLTSSTVASNLEKGEHTARIYASSQQACPQIGGFAIDAGEKTLKINKGKTIEFIGDSITEGYVAPDDAEKWGANSYLNSYAYLTGEKLNRKYFMQYNTVAFGGIGVCTYDTKDKPTQDYMTMNERYKKVREFIYGDTTATSVDEWNMSAYTPDYIVVNLGTNDCRSGEENFKTQCKNFLMQLRSYYPKATVVAMIPCYFYQAELDGYVNALKTAVSETGDGNIYILDTADWGILGGKDNLHPSPASQRETSEKLFAYLENLINPPVSEITPTPTPTPTSGGQTPAPTVSPEQTNKPVFSGGNTFNGGKYLLAVAFAFIAIAYLNRRRLLSYLKK